MSARLYALRGEVLFAAFLLLFCFRWLSDSPLQPLGLLLWLIGQLLRVWAALSIGPHTNSRGIRGDFLSVSGAYAFIRNPMYIGNILTCEALIIFANCLPAAMHLALLFGIFIHHHLLVLAEEKYWRTRKPKEFARYTARTPRWVGVLYPVGNWTWVSSGWQRAFRLQWRNIFKAVLATVAIGIAA